LYKELFIIAAPPNLPKGRSLSPSFGGVGEAFIV